MLNPFVNGVFYVRSDECSTLIVEVGWFLALKCNLCNILHFYTEGLKGGFFQK